MTRRRSSSGRPGLAALALALLPGACAGPLQEQAVPGRLVVREVDYNPTHVPIEVRDADGAVVDDGSQLVIVGPSSLTVLRGGVLAAVVGAPELRLAAEIPAADGSGRWLVAVDASGRLQRLRAGREPEPIGDRYGFAGVGLRAACSLGGEAAAFLVGSNGLAIADGRTVRRYQIGPTRGLACGPGRVALLADAALRTFTVSSQALRSFPIAAVGAAFDARGRLWAASGRGLYAEDPTGELHLRYRSSSGPIGSLAGTPARLWFTAGSELGVVENERIAVTSGAEVMAGRLFGAAGGDVYLSAHGRLQRWSRSDGAGGTDGRWAELVAPVFARSCSACHLPGGRAGVDLSTAAAWQSQRELIRERVIDKRNMPPAGNPLAESERDAIRRWLDGSR